MSKQQGETSSDRHDGVARAVSAGGTHDHDHARARPSRPLRGRTGSLRRARRCLPDHRDRRAESYEPLDDAIAHMYGYELAGFYQRQRRGAFMRRLEAAGGTRASLTICACVRSARRPDRLRDARVHVDVVPEEFKAEGVFTAIERFLGGRESLRGQIFLFRARPWRVIIFRARSQKRGRAPMWLPLTARFAPNHGSRAHRSVARRRRGGLHYIYEFFDRQQFRAVIRDTDLNVCSMECESPVSATSPRAPPRSTAYIRYSTERIHDSGARAGHRRLLRQRIKGPAVSIERYS